MDKPKSAIAGQWKLWPSIHSNSTGATQTKQCFGWFKKMGRAKIVTICMRFTKLMVSRLSTFVHNTKVCRLSFDTILGQLGSLSYNGINGSRSVQFPPDRHVSMIAWHSFHFEEIREGKKVSNIELLYQSGPEVEMAKRSWSSLQCHSLSLLVRMQVVGFLP